jgi:hypothetical protein
MIGAPRVAPAFQYGLGLFFWSARSVMALRPGLRPL